MLATEAMAMMLVAAKMTMGAMAAAAAEARRKRRRRTRWAEEAKLACDLTRPVWSDGAANEALRRTKRRRRM